MTVGEMPSHSHSASTNTTGNHSHSMQGWFGQNSSNKAYPSTYDTNYREQDIWTNSSGNHSHTVAIGNTGSNQAHNNLQPYIVVYIWKRKN